MPGRAYANRHQRVREVMLAALVPGQSACWRCGRLVVPAGPGRRGQDLHLDHVAGLESPLRAITHSWCNTGKRTLTDGKPPLIDCSDGGLNPWRCRWPGKAHDPASCRAAAGTPPPKPAPASPARTW